jgi:hypothetical protein
MAVTAYWYANAFVSAFDKEIDFLADTVRVMLTDSSYTANQDTHVYIDDGPRANEISGTGYTADGAALGSKTNANTNNVVKFDAANTQWTTSTITDARCAVVYVDTGTDSTSALMFWVDFGEDQSTTGDTFEIEWHADGIATITAADATGFP